MVKKDNLDKFYNNISSFLKEQEETDKFMDYFYNSFLSGETVLYQKNIAEFKNFDNEWLNTLENYLPSIQKIINNPKSNLKFEEELVPVEKAKKITPASIRHLAQNTHLIKEVDAEGNVIPKKVLTSISEMDLAIYENRFVMTLINRLAQFVGNRYEVIKNNISSKQRNHLSLKSNYNINNSEVIMEIDLEVRNDIEDSSLKERNEKLMERVTKIVKLINSFKGSQFMQDLKGQKPVLPPIMKTNIILKNPDFRNAYSLWLFLDSYNALIFDIDVQEKDLDIDRDYIADMNQLALLTYSFVLFNQDTREEIYDDAEQIQYVRKATKIVRTNPRDIVEDPGVIQMEDNNINEYYLDQNQKLFKKSLSDLLSDDISFEEALKRAMTQTMDITNSLFKSVFETNSTVQDDFSNILKRKSLQEELEDAKKRSEIARMVRETKEKDLKETIELEKQQLKEIANIHNEMISEKSVKKRFSKDKDAIKELTAEVKASRQAKNKVNIDKKDIEEAIYELSEFRKSLVTEQQMVYQNTIEKVDKELIAAEKERANLERKEALAELRRERKEALEKERQWFKEERARVRTKYKEMQLAIIEEEKQSRQLELEKLQNQYILMKEQAFEKLKRMSN